MDGGFQVTKAWQNTSDYNTAGSIPSLAHAQNVPGVGIGYITPFSNAHEHRLPPLSTAFDTQRPARRENISPVDNNPARSSHRQTPTSSPTERPDKRPRWHYHQTSATSQSSRQEADAYLPTPNVSAQPRTSSSWDTPRTDGGSGIEGCFNCYNTQELISSVVSGLLCLEAEIRRSFAPVNEPHLLTDDSGYEITKKGLRQSLLWASNSISSSSRIVRDVAVGQRSLAPLPHVVANVALERPNQLEHSMVTSAPTDQSNRVSDQLEKDRAEDPGHRLIPSTQLDRLHHPFDILPPILPFDPMKKGHPFDQTPQGPAPSPHRSSSGSIFGSVPSPMQSHSSRTLPSPSAFQFSPPASGGPGNYSPSHPQTAHTAHLQDLQHQISTKTLALQTLQREHDQLLAAFSRSQMRCSTLDKKSQVSDHEINTLTEEKIRLQQQVEAFESQVEDLVIARDEAQKRSTADGEQWRQIMTMSSQLQAKTIDETRSYRADREAWEQDRASLQQRIQDLEAGKLNVVQSGDSEVSRTPISPDDTLASASLDVLREEIFRLRRSCGEMEDLLQQIKGETDEMDHAMTTVSSARERIKRKLRQGLHKMNEEG